MHLANACRMYDVCGKHMHLSICIECLLEIQRLCKSMSISQMDKLPSIRHSKRMNYLYTYRNYECGE